MGHFIYKIFAKTKKSCGHIAKLAHCRKLIFKLVLSTRNMSLRRNYMKRIIISFTTMCAEKENLYKHVRHKYSPYFSLLKNVF